MDYLFLISGIIILLISGDWLVKGGSNLAKYFKLPPFVIGVTIISFGTSAPELFVSLNASINGNPDIALGNIIGSNIANIGLVLGVTALIICIPIAKSILKLDFPVLIISEVIFILFMLDLKISRLEGIILVLMMICYIAFIILRNNKSRETQEIETHIPRPIVSLVIIIITCIGLVIGSHLLVDGASGIAKNLGISERIISITVIAVGTSLPELATSVIAAIRKELDISIGNIIGSNIFNILMIAGLSAVVTPLNVNPKMLELDAYAFLGFVVLLGLSFFPLKNPKINKIKGLVMLFAYIGYCVVLFY